MKKKTVFAFLSALGLALMMTQGAFAEPSETLQGIFDALMTEDSDYSQEKALYTEYFPGITYEETIQEDGFAITISESEYMDGSWTFTQDGDYLTATLDSEDYIGLSEAMNVMNAVGIYYDMNTEVLNGYISGLNLLGMENPYFIMEEDGASTKVSIYIAGPYDMEGLDEMVLGEEALDYEPLTEEYRGMASSIGRLMMVANGNVDELTMLIGEYGGLDDLAYQSVINAVSILQPRGWESFVADYTELTDAEGEGYSVTVNADASAVDEIIDDRREGDSYVLLHFGE